MLTNDRVSFEQLGPGIFLFLNKNMCCGYTLEGPQAGASNEYPQHMFSWRNKKKILFCYPLLFGDIGQVKVSKHLG